MSFASEYINHSASVLAESFNPASTAFLGVHLQTGYCRPCAPLRMLIPPMQNFYKCAGKTLDAKQGFRSFIVDDMIFEGPGEAADPDEYCRDRASDGIYMIRSSQVQEILRHAAP